MANNQEERRNIRLVTGSVNPETGVALPASGCIPFQVQKTGQFTTDGVNVLGDGTAVFESEFMVDMWLYSASLNEIRQVKGVSGDKNMELYFAFSANIAVAENVYIVASGKYSYVKVVNTGAATADVQEVPLPNNYEDERESELGLAPFTYDALTSTLMFHISE